MFREMRRINQVLSKDAAIAILQTATSGVLAVLGDEGYPYAIPLSYVYHQDKLYIHCANSGHKLDAIQQHNKVSFCVIDKDQVVSEKYTTYYRSVVLFGKAKVLEGEAKREGIELLAAKYSPEQVEGREKEITAAWERFSIIEVTIEHISGKVAIELINH